MDFVRNLFGKAQKKEITPPSAETLEKAKKIFFEYSCNGLYMAQNDVHFEQYHISYAQQTEWRNEFVAYWRSQLSTEDLTAIQKLRDAYAVEAIPDMLSMTDQGDSYARLRIAEGLWVLSYWVKDRKLRKQTSATARKMAQSILDRPIEVSESHRIEIASLGGTDPKEYVILFATSVVNDDK